MPSPSSRPSAPRLDILFEDDALLVAVKPAGLATAHAPRGVPSLFTQVQAHVSRGRFVGVVSRLDAPVSGLVVMAKTRAAAAGLAAQFRDRTVEKAYLAVCGGRFPAAIGTWVEWRDDVARPGATEPEIRTQPAHTRARVTKRAGEVSLVELMPSTGRRHQLRVQLGSRGCPIAGDRLYDEDACGPATPPLALHAVAIDVPHPTTGGRVTLVAPPPPVPPWHRFAAAVTAASAAWPTPPPSANSGRSGPDP